MRFSATLQKPWNFRYTIYEAETLRDLSATCLVRPKRSKQRCILVAATLVPRMASNVVSAPASIGTFSDLLSYHISHYRVSNAQ